MILYVDIGNSCLKWRFQNRHQDEVYGRIENSKLSEVWIETLLKESDAGMVILSNVSNESITSLFSIVAKKQNIDFVFVKPRKEMAGLRFAYEEISSLGVDRCLAMIGAYQNKPVLVIDAGSAITADFVNSNGEHVGGYILPGCRMLLGTLNAGTSRIDVEPHLGNDEPGVTTKECVSNGLTLLIHSFLKGLVNKARSMGIEEYVITGGDAEYLVKVSNDISLSRKENLVLDGMQRLCKLGWFEVSKEL